MTERHEITSLIEILNDVSTEVKYEAETKPGEGEEFSQTLFLAMEHVDSAIEELKKAEKTLTEEK